MNNKQEQLAQRRTLLISQAAGQREDLALAFSTLHAPLSVADKGLQALRYLKQHPMLIAGALTLAVALRPKRWLFVLENGWLIWRMALAAKRRLMD